MRFRWAVLLVCLGALASMGPVGSRLSGGFLPPNDKAQYQVRLRAPEGTSVAETMLIAERVAQDAARMPGVTNTLVTVGADDQRTANVAVVRVLMSDPGTRQVSQMDVMQRTRTEIIPRHPASLRMTVEEVPDIGGTGSNAPVQLALQGPDLAQLGRYANQLSYSASCGPASIGSSPSCCRCCCSPPGAIALTVDGARRLGAG